jgi:hypothetical protein
MSKLIRTMDDVPGLSWGRRMRCSDALPYPGSCEEAHNWIKGSRVGKDTTESVADSGYTGKYWQRERELMFQELQPSAPDIARCCLSGVCIRGA